MGLGQDETNQRKRFCFFEFAYTLDFELILNIKTFKYFSIDMGNLRVQVLAKNVDYPSGA